MTPISGIPVHDVEESKVITEAVVASMVWYGGKRGASHTAVAERKQRAQARSGLASNL